MNVSRRYLAIAALALAALGALVAAAALRPGWPAGGLASAPQVDYTLLDGQRHNTAGLKGQVVLVNFWATSCSSCVAEMPEIAATHQKFKALGFQTLAVAMQSDPPALVAEFALRRQLPFGVVIDNTGEIARRFGDVQLTPTSFLINRRGEIVKRFVGTPDFAALQALVAQLLAEVTPADA